jgi:hypothetical protein
LVQSAIRGDPEAALLWVSSPLDPGGTKIVAAERSRVLFTPNDARTMKPWPL